MSLLVRPFARIDAEALTRLHAAAFDPPQLGQAYWRGARTTAPNLCMVAEEDGEIVAYCDGFLAGEGGDVNSVASLPGRRGEGLGRAVLSAFLGEARKRGASLIHLEVAEANVAAVRLYGALGFTPVGRRRGYYADGQDAVVMACALADCSRAD